MKEKAEKETFSEVFQGLHFQSLDSHSQEKLCSDFRYLK